MKPLTQPRPIAARSRNFSLDPGLFAGNDTLVNAGLFFKICECSRVDAGHSRYGCGSAACRYTSARQFAPFLRKSPANSRLPKGPTESSAPTTILALSCRGGRLCPPADRTGFYGNLRRIRGCPAGRCGHRPLHDSGKFVLPRKFRMQGGEDGAVGDASETASTERASALCAKSLILCVRFLLSKPQTLCWFAAWVCPRRIHKTAPFRSNGAVHAYMGGGSYSAEMR